MADIDSGGSRNNAKMIRDTEKVFKTHHQNVDLKPNLDHDQDIILHMTQYLLEHFWMRSAEQAHVGVSGAVMMLLIVILSQSRGGGEEEGEG